ncbi:MAG: hypothetical protein GXY58_14770 [Planctomycetaceae bacterium]|nr:hypothetical protein [Planctomycetaceae bacterium]
MITKLLQTIGIGLWTVLLIGCGTTKSQRATEQLLMSDVVDRSVANIDFRPLSGRHVYLDTTYVQNVKTESFVNADYIISSVRQQMLGAGCLLEENRQDAEYVAELRVGTLGTDSHELTYGIPANNALSSAASLVPSAPVLPAVPEISLARKNHEHAAAKIAVFAYHRESRRPVWQSGIVQARSRAKNIWFFGAGPFQTGTIYEGTKFVGGDLPLPLLTVDQDDVTGRVDPMATYSRETTYLPPTADHGDVKPAGYEGPLPPAAESEAPAAPAETPAPPAETPVPPAEAPAEAPAEPAAAPPDSN